MTRKLVQHLHLILAFVGTSLSGFAQGNAKATPVRSGPGFSGEKILQVFNQIPFIKNADDFTVTESTRGSSNTSFKVNTGMVYFSFQDKLAGNTMYWMYCSTNNFSFMGQKPIFSQETGLLHFPDFWMDTFALQYTYRNGALVGVGVDPKHSGASDTFFVLNPRLTPLFKPVTKEEFSRFILALFQYNLDKRTKERRDELAYWDKTSTGIDASNTQLRANIKRNIQSDSLWIAYYQRRIAEYKAGLDAMTPQEKQQAAYAAYPKLLASESDKKGNLVDEIRGGYPFELLKNRSDAADVFPLYEVNPSFFDKTLSPSAVQVMVFRDINGSDRSNAFGKRVKYQFFPEVDFNAFAKLMYK